MEETIARVWDQLTSRIGGPLSLRLVIQPIVSTTLAVRAGVRDARDHRTPFLWSLVVDPRHRRDHFRTAWHDVSLLFGVAVALDVVYQIAVLRFFYPLQALAVAGVLAFVPYVLVRGLVTRAVTAFRHPTIGRPSS